MKGAALSPPAVVAATLLAVAALGGCARYQAGTLAEARRETADAAWDGDVAVSPDGRSVAFVSEREDGRRGLFVRPAKDGEPRALAAGPGGVSRPSWSPDGRRILFTRSDSAGVEAAVVVDAVAGDARPLAIAAARVRDAVFAPDGAHLACVARGDSTWSLAEVTLSDLALRALFSAGPDEPPSRPAWLPDGRALVFAWRGDLWWTGADGGAPTCLTPGPAHESDAAVSPDGRWLAFVSDSTGVLNLWLARLERGRPAGAAPALGAWRPVTAAFQPSGGPAWAPRGHTLWFHRADAWRVVARDLAGGGVDTLSSSLFDDFGPSWSGDGFNIAFVSNRSGSEDLWIMGSAGEAASGPARRVTRDPGAETMPDWSHASGRIAYVSDRAAAGGTSLWLTDPTGATLGALTDGGHHDVEPRWSPDGRAVAFTSDRERGTQVWMLEGIDRALRRVTSDPAGGARAPDFTPDGRALLYAAPRDGRPALWRVPAAGGMPVPLTSDEVPGSWDARQRVSPDGARVVFTRCRRGDADLWLLDLATGEARALIENPLGADDHADWSPDGRRLVYQTGGAVDLYRADVGPLLRP